MNTRVPKLIECLIKSGLGAIPFVLLHSVSVHAQITSDNDWLGGDGNWSDGTKWAEEVPPAGGDYRAYFRIAADVANVTVDGNFLFNRWYVQNNQTVNLSMDPGSSLETTTGFQAYQGGTLNVFGPETGLATITNNGGITTGHNNNPSFVTYSGPNLVIHGNWSIGRNGSNSTVRFEDGVVLENTGNFVIGATVNDNTGLALNNHVTFSGAGTVMNSVNNVNLVINVASRPKFIGSNPSGPQSTSYQEYNSLTVEDGAQILIDNSYFHQDYPANTSGPTLAVGQGGTYKRHNWIEITGAGSLIEFKAENEHAETFIGRATNINYDNYMILSDGGTYKTNSTTQILNSIADDSGEEKNRLIIADGGSYITSRDINVMGGMVQLDNGGSLIGQNFDHQTVAVSLNVSGSLLSPGRFEAAGDGLGSSVTVNLEAESVLSVGSTQSEGAETFTLYSSINMFRRSAMEVAIHGASEMDHVLFEPGSSLFLEDGVFGDNVALRVRFKDGYEPTAGETFTLFAGSVDVSGTFGSLNLPELWPYGLAWDISGLNDEGGWVLAIIEGAGPGELLAYEYFEYAEGFLGAETAGGTGWTNDPAGWYFRGTPSLMPDSTPTTVAVQPGSMDPPAYPFIPAGNHVRLSNNSAYRALEDPLDLSEEGTEYFFSYIIKALSVTESTNNYNSLIFGTDETALLTISLRWRAKNGIPALRLQNHISGHAESLGDDELDFDKEYFVVGRIANDNGMVSFRASVFSDAVPGPENPATWQIVSSDIDPSKFVDINMVRLRAHADAEFLFDEFRLGTTAQAVAFPMPDPPSSVSRIYVAPHGNDSNDGLTRQSPILTLQRAHAILEYIRPSNDVHVVIAPGRYRGQQTTWTYVNPNHSVRFAPPANAEGRVVFDGQLEDGTYPGGTWFLLTYSGGTDTNLIFENLVITNYWDAISLMGNRNNPDGYSANNQIKHCVFDRIGNTFNPSLPPSTAVIRFVNSKYNVVYNNDFIDVENVTDGNLIHAIYAAHLADYNVISRNRFINHSGDSVRIRDYSFGNYISDNYYIQAGRYGYSEWYCDHNIRDDCTKPTAECPSWFNQFNDNYLVSRYGGGTIPVIHFYQDYIRPDCSEPEEGAWRVQASGNEQISASQATSWHLWLHRNYTREERDQGLVMAPGYTPDGYGASNLARYALGIDQRSARPEDMTRLQPNGEGGMDVSWPENKEANRANVVLQYSTDMQNWQNTPWPVQTKEDDLWGRSVKMVSVPGETAGKVFLRLHISLN